MGLALSLFLNGFFLAAHIKRERNCLTLPNVMAKRNDKLVDGLVGLVSIIWYRILLILLLVATTKRGVAFCPPSPKPAPVELPSHCRMNTTATTHDDDLISLRRRTVMLMCPSTRPTKKRLWSYSWKI